MSKQHIEWYGLTPGESVRIEAATSVITFQSAIYGGTTNFNINTGNVVFATNAVPDASESTYAACIVMDIV